MPCRHLKSYYPELEWENKSCQTGASFMPKSWIVVWWGLHGGPTVLLIAGFKLHGCSPTFFESEARIYRLFVCLCRDQHVGLLLIVLASSCVLAASLLKQQSTWGHNKIQSQYVRAMFSVSFQALMVKAAVGSLPIRGFWGALWSAKT